MSGARSGELTLDIGCGYGELIAALTEVGCSVIGTEIDSTLVDACQGHGFDVRQGKAESLPFEDETFDRIVCSVVIPYTEEKKAIAEWARTLKPGGRAYATYHGIGYGMDYMLRGSRLKTRAYGIRMLANTGYFWATGRRLPGAMGDTTCQSTQRLRSYYRDLGLVLECEYIASTFLSFPRFICHQVSKTSS